MNVFKAVFAHWCYSASTALSLTLNSPGYFLTADPGGMGPFWPPPPLISAAERRKILKFGTCIEHIEKDFLAQNFNLKFFHFFVIMQIYANYMHKLHFNWYKINLKVLKLETCFNFVANLFDTFLKKKNDFFFFLISYVFYCFFNFLCISLFFDFCFLLFFQLE